MCCFSSVRQIVVIIAGPYPPGEGGGGQGEAVAPLRFSDFNFFNLLNLF